MLARALDWIKSDFTTQLNNLIFIPVEGDILAFGAARVLLARLLESDGPTVKTERVFGKHAPQKKQNQKNCGDGKWPSDH